MINLRETCVFPLETQGLYSTARVHNFFRPGRNGNSVGSEVTHRPMAAEINRCRLTQDFYWLFWKEQRFYASRGFDPLQWRHNDSDGVSNHQPHDCLVHCLLKPTSKKTSKLHVIGLCEGNSPVTDEFPSQRASDAKNVFIWWRHQCFRIQTKQMIVYSGHL